MRSLLGARAAAFAALVIALGPSAARAQHRPASTAADSAHPGHDTAFTALKARGRVAMGVDQHTSTHHFTDLADGGRIRLEQDTPDSAGVAAIRAHLRRITRAFAAGDFATPAFVHAGEVPGTRVMAARHDRITYTFNELPRGGEVWIKTADPEARAAVRAFLAFQRREHHAEQ